MYTLHHIIMLTYHHVISIFQLGIIWWNIKISIESGMLYERSHILLSHLF